MSQVTEFDVKVSVLIGNYFNFYVLLNLPYFLLRPILDPGPKQCMPFLNSKNRFKILKKRQKIGFLSCLPEIIFGYLYQRH